VSSILSSSMKGKEVRQEDPKTRARPSVFKGCLLTRPRGEEGGSARKAKAHNLEVTGSL